jgi:N-acetylneuraminate synthase
MNTLQPFFTKKNCLVVAEVAQAHDGSLGMAHAFIDAIADTGADAVKFQTHIAEAESTPGEPWRIKFSLQDKTRYDYWKRMEFTKEQWRELAVHARQKNLIFFSSPFSVEAVDLLEELDVPFWKLGSGEIMCKPLIDRMTLTRKPIFISTGMCTLNELDTCVDWLRKAANEFVIFQCTSEYPCPPEKIGINLLSFYKHRYNCLVGLSDHSGSVYPGIAAAVMGASIVEVHVTFSKKMFGPDVPASLTIEELKSLVDGVDFVERMLANPADKATGAQDFADLRKIFYKSLVAKVDISANTVIDEGMLTCKKPGDGIPAHRLPEFVGKRICKDVRADQQLKEEDFYD